MSKRRRLLLIGEDMLPEHGVVSGVTTYCQEHGSWEYHIEKSTHSHTISRVRRAIHDWKADGIIVHLSSREMERLLQRSRLPVVNVSGSIDSRLPAVLRDDAAIGRMGARFFLDNGFRHFGFSSLTAEGYAQRRGEAFASELESAGYHCSLLTDRCDGPQEEDWVGNRQRMDRWLVSLPKPVGVLCIYDYRAQEVSLACQRLGLRVPDDVAILGVGNSLSACQMNTPALSSVDVNLGLLGYQAARLVHRMILGGKRPEKPVLIPPRYVVGRRSSDTVAVDDLMVAGALRFIRDHAHEPIGVKNVVEKSGISRNTLERHFRTALGRSPAAEIARNRIERAKALLRDTQMPISNVARDTGFSNAKAFAVGFRHRVGAAPSEYRERCQRAG